ncbi:MAG: G5 domain-containing protein, partial [Candidatus Eremiobacteraeota bacterium]|nr:G5 domain-containing protein [Candidatus Eremiobacteraeota bacterium]
MTRHPELRIAAIASLIVVCATTTSAASIARHLGKHAHHPPPTPLSSYSVSMTLPDRPLDVARQTDNPSVVASADEFYDGTKFDDLRGTATVVRPQVRIVAQYRTQRQLVALEPEVRLAPGLRPGQRKVLKAGTPALEDVTERIVTWDEVVMQRQVLRARVLHRGIPAVVLQGAPLTWNQLAATTKYRKLLGV